MIVIEELDPFLEEQINAIGINVTGKDMLPLTGSTVRASGQDFLQ